MNTPSVPANRRLLPRSSSAVGLVLALLASVGCAEEVPEPNIASSAGHAGYAERYPEEVDATRQQFLAQEKDTKELSKGFSAYPDALDNPKWPTVRQVVDLADAEGRSQAYVESYEQVDAAGRFFLEHRDPIRQKVSGGAQYAAKQKGCEADVGGAAAHALDTGVQKELEDALHDGSEAHSVIDAHQEELGPKNVETLRDQADTISRASYLAHVGAVRSKQRLEALVTETEEIKKTLDRRIEELNTVLKDANAPEADKKTATAELEAARAAKARVDQQAAAARPVAERAREAVETLQREYAESLKRLRDKLEQKGGKAAPSSATQAR